MVGQPAGLGEKSASEQHIINATEHVTRVAGYDISWTDIILMSSCDTVTRTYQRVV